MEFRSTLERETERVLGKVRHWEENGEKASPLVDKVFELLVKSPRFNDTYLTAVHVAKTIQPSITLDDCRLAVNMQLALCCDLVLHLIEDKLLIIKESDKKEI
jgi:hypothetical protein